MKICDFPPQIGKGQEAEKADENCSKASTNVTSAA